MVLSGFDGHRKVLETNSGHTWTFARINIQEYFQVPPDSDYNGGREAPVHHEMW